MAQIEIIKEMLKLLPEKAVSEAAFEGANIVFYTKDKEFFQDSNGAIRGLVQEFKKRVELRADPSIMMELEAAEKVIREMVLVDGMDQPAVHRPCPYQTIGQDGRLTADSIIGFPEIRMSGLGLS